MTSKKLRDHIDELKVIKHHILPQAIKVGEEYHVPPFFTIKRMDIIITSTENGVVKFKILNDPSNKEEKTMEYSSILSRFLVKKVKF
jgi:hypothetical protein